MAAYHLPQHTQQSQLITSTMPLWNNDATHVRNAIKHPQTIPKAKREIAEYNFNFISAMAESFRRNRKDNTRQSYPYNSSKLYVQLLI